MKDRWDLKALIMDEITTRGGWVNSLAHLDRAYSITKEDLPLIDAPLQAKWNMVDKLKRESSVDQIYDRMAFGVEQMLSQGVVVIGTFIDVDDVIKDKAIKAAAKLRDEFEGDVRIIFINQVLKGVLKPKAREWFNRAVEFVDIIGSLPATDKGREDEHLDIVLSTAKDRGKLAYVHVDQNNTAEERETELLILKTREHGMEGRVVAIHGVSIAAQPRAYRELLYKDMKAVDMMLITCPTAWIDARRTEELAPVHNAIAPVDELVPAGITVALGTDNIADLFKPFADGDMWTELRFLLETCNYNQIEELAKIATENGRRVLGLNVQ